MSALIEGLEAVTVHVRDIQKARVFYREVLGLEEAAFNEAVSRAAFRIPGSSTQLVMHIMAPDEGGREPGTVSGLVFTNSNPAAAAAEVRRRGGTVVSGPDVLRLPGLTATRVVLADPDGNEFIVRSKPVSTPS